MKSLIIMFLFFMAGSVHASSTLIDFEDVTTPIFDYPDVFYNTEGYELSTFGGVCAGDGDRIASISSDGISIEQPSPEPAVCGIGIQMTRSDSNSFAIHSFDISTFGSANYIGTLAGGGTADLSVVVGTGDWLNLEYVQFRADNQLFNSIQVDNIAVSAVPIPAAVWLFGSALAGLGWLRRKQTA